MEKPANSCVNHPQTAAKRKCYQCLAYICPACQKRAGGHIFCSSRCYRRHWVSERMGGVKSFFVRVGLRLRRFGKSAERLTGGWVFRFMFLALLLTVLYQTILLTRIVSEISLPAETSSPIPAMPSAELVQEGEWVTLAGSAPGFNVAILLADGVERETCAVRENRFSFHFQPGEGSRSVQVQVFGDGVPSLFTKPVPLPEKEPPTADQTPVPGEGAAGAGSPGEMETVEKAGKDIAEKTAERKTGKPGGSLPSVLPTAYEEDISRGKAGAGRVAITFDGGSYDNAAGKILDVLAERNLEATFFLTGEFMRRHPEMTRRIAREGHEVGNHTYSHLHLTTYEKNFRHETLPGVTKDLVLKELSRNQDLYFALTGHRMVKLWRAPYGEQNQTIRRWAGEAGYRHVSWTYDPKTRKSLDTLDWVADEDSALFLSSDQIVEKILSFDTETEMGLEGGIVLLHLGSERSQDPFHPKLGILIDRLQERGYLVGPVGQLLPAGG